MEKRNSLLYVGMFLTTMSMQPSSTDMSTSFASSTSSDEEDVEAQQLLLDALDLAVMVIKESVVDSLIKQAQSLLYVNDEGKISYDNYSDNKRHAYSLHRDLLEQGPPDRVIALKNKAGAFTPFKISEVVAAIE